MQRLADDAAAGGGDGRRSRSEAPETLIRTVDGHITYWSSGMTRRYGYTAEHALGAVSHEMLQTMSPRPLPEIQAWLLEHGTWTGLLLHRRADGGLAATATAWYLHDIRGGVVTEVHGDLPGLAPTARVYVADLLAVLRHELAQPLTAIGSYLNGAQLMLQAGQTDPERMRTALALAAQQVDRGGEATRLLRDLAVGFRDTD